MSFTIPSDLDYHDHICIRWRVKLPTHFNNYESNSVCFRKSELTLRLILPPKSLILQIKSNPVLGGVYGIEAFLLDKNDSTVHRKAKFVTFNTPYYVEVWSTDKNLFFSDQDNLLTNGELNFVCVVNFTQYRCQEFGKLRDATQPNDTSLEKLSLDVSKLCKSSEHSDVSLKCGDRAIPAHKFLLSARSDVFAAMFRNDVIECREGVIHIQDIEFPILDHLLKYMYSGKMDGEVSTDTAVQLYRAADKYDVCSLRHKCASVLIRDLREDNVCEILVLADSHSDKALKRSVLSYLTKKDEFLLSDQWRSFAKIYASLAVEAYDAFVWNMSQK